MASTKDYLDYILDLLKGIKGITYKKMMGEYILYKDGMIFGGIYDNRFLLKKNDLLSKEGMKEETPYPGAKQMLLVNSEDTDEIERLIYLCIL